MLADLIVMVLEKTITEDKISAKIGQISAETVTADVGRAEDHGPCCKTVIAKLNWPESAKTTQVSFGLCWPS